jgi:hypothetical protein
MEARYQRSILRRRVMNEVSPATGLPGLTASRRQFLSRCGMGMGGLSLAGLLAEETSADQSPTHFLGRARHVIHVFLNGGMSQVDTFDPKPELTKRGGQMLPFDNLQTERRTGVALPSPFKFKQHGESGIPVSDLFPQLANCVDDRCMPNCPIMRCLSCS